MARTVYIETTVVSYLTARPSRDLIVAGRQEATRALWPRLVTDYDAYISALVYLEASRGDSEQSRLRLEAIAGLPMLDVDDRSRSLAEAILRAGAVSMEFPEDALHIAVAAANGIEVFLTWNFAHLNNPFTRARVRQAIQECGYTCPETSSPDELQEAEA